MDKGVNTKLNDLVKIFSLGLEDIEKETLVKLKDVEKLIEQYNRYISEVKTQEKENDKKLEVAETKLAQELVKQHEISKAMENELAKHTKLTAEIQTNKNKGDEAVRMLQSARSEAIIDLENRKKATQELKNKIIEVEKLKDVTIKKTKENEIEYQKLLVKEAEINRDRSKIEKDKIELGDQQTNLAIRIKNIERLEKQIQLKAS